MKLKKLLTATGIAAALLSASIAQANTNTFSGLTGSITSLPSYTEDGITATPTSGSFWGWPSEGQLHLDPSGFAGNTVNFTFASGLFNLNSLDISYASSGAVGALTAFDTSNNVLFTTNINASVTGTVNFGTWNNIARLQLVDSGSHLSVDNLTLTAAVPEPETYALLLAGLGCMGAIVRRRKAKQA